MKFNFRQAVWNWNYAQKKALKKLDIGLLIDPRFWEDHDIVA